MNSRAIAFTLALLFALSSAAMATPGTCCVANAPAPRSLVAMDCCAAVAECPMQLKATEPAVIQAAAPASAPTVHEAVSESPDSARNHLRIFSLVSSRAPDPDRPPLYRLHAQLLI